MGWLLGWLWGPGSAGSNAQRAHRAQREMTSSAEASDGYAVALQMAGSALGAKNRTIAELQRRLEQAEQRSKVAGPPPALAAQAAQEQASTAQARLLAALSRCQELEQRLNAAPGERRRAVQAALHSACAEEQAAAHSRLEAELAAARGEARRLAAAQQQLVGQLEAERAASQEARQQLGAANKQRAAVRQQLQAVKGELAEARRAQDSAAGALALLDADFAALRQENAEVGAAGWGSCVVCCPDGATLAPALHSRNPPRHLHAPPVRRAAQLQSMLTQRESAYLTLLETVQVGGQAGRLQGIPVCDSAA